MEVYVLLGLVSLGYMFTKKAVDPLARDRYTNAVKTRRKELPAHRRYAPGQTVEDVRTQELIRAQDAERAAKYPMQTGAVDPRSRAYSRNPLDSPVRSELAGVDLSMEDFRHNNMQPYFGSSLKASDPYSDNSALMERFTGAPGPGNQEPKREVSALFSPEERSEITNVHGNQGFSGPLQERFNTMNMVNTVRNNELPFEQVKVGPGLGQGYTSSPTGGFAQNQDRDIAMGRFKTVDELRPGNKPKANLEGRTLAGAVAGGSRGLIGQTAKNRPSTAFDIGDRGWVPTDSPVQGMTVRSDPVAGRELRNPPSTYRVEVAGPGRQTEGAPLPITYDQTNKFGAPKFQEETPDLTGASFLGLGNRGQEDMLRQYTAPAPNERNQAGENWSRAMMGGPPGDAGKGYGVRSHVGDGLRLSNKEHTSDAAASHMFGNMAPQAPARGPAYDPVMHRPRTTVKETQIHDGRTGNMQAQMRGVAAGEGEGTRRTVREGFCDTYDQYSVRNIQPPMVQEGEGAPTADPRDHDLGATLKELASDARRIGGVAPSGAASVAPGGYSVASLGQDEPPLTQRQFTEQNQYYGTGGRPESYGYAKVHGDMLDSMTTNGGRATDFEYYGIPKHKNEKGLDYAQLYAATLQETKQALLETRAPGGHAGPKRAPNEFTQGDVTGRDDPYVMNYTSNPNMPSTRAGEGSVHFSANAGLSHDDRIDEQLLSWLRTNPLVASPASGHHTANIPRAGE